MRILLRAAALALLLSLPPLGLPAPVRAIQPDGDCDKGQIDLERSDGGKRTRVNIHIADENGLGSFPWTVKWENYINGRHGKVIGHFSASGAPHPIESYETLFSVTSGSGRIHAKLTATVPMLTGGTCSVHDQDVIDFGG